MTHPEPIAIVQYADGAPPWSGVLAALAATYSDWLA